MEKICPEISSPIVMPSGSVEIFHGSCVEKTCGKWVTWPIWRHKEKDFTRRLRPSSEIINNFTEEESGACAITLNNGGCCDG